MEDELTKIEKENIYLRTHLHQLHEVLEGNRNESQSKDARINKLQRRNQAISEQLSQVENELGSSFSKHKELTEKVEKTSSYLRSVFECNIDYSYFDKIEVENVYQKDNEQLLLWKIKDCYISGRCFAELIFQTRIEFQEVSISLFRKSINDDQVMMSWPSAYVDKEECVISPSNHELLNELTCSDWWLVIGLCKIILDLRSDLSIRSMGFDWGMTYSGVTKLLSSFSKEPSVLRFDNVKIRQELVDSSYEHLWLTLNNVSLGSQFWTRFSFRLACNDEDGQFGMNPRLVFPDSSRNILQSWFVESEDHLGEKLELRFSLPKDMDMAIWERLLPTDQLFILMLIQRTPVFLNALKQEDVKISRSWQDWERLIQSVVGILRKNRRALLK